MAFLSFSSDEKTDEKGDSLPPREEAFPYGEGGTGKARDG